MPPDPSLPKSKQPRLVVAKELPPTISLKGVDPASTLPHQAEPPKVTQKRLGRFEIRSRLGGGAFGEVFRAYDPKLDREIALKVARPQRLDDPQDLERFFREARAAAQFTHPNIVPVYEVGQEGRYAYLVASLIEGDTLGAALSSRRFSPAETVGVILQLANALHYAHLKGVFHRDIKPGNVMLDQAGKAHLTDFGLARRLEGETLRTQEGDILGTPAYMSPEQARGDSRLVDARSDLYSLGVVLYEMLCGRRPFNGSVFDVLSKVQTEEPKRPRLIEKHIPLDLEAICLKALAKQPDERYRSVEHFAEDLRRWQQNLPVEARRINPVQRAGKWVRRHPLVTAGLVAFIAMLASFVTYQQTRPGWLDLSVSPAQDVTVKLGQKEISVDSEGRVLAQFPPGRYQLVVSALGHESQTRDVLLVRGRENAAIVTMSLEPSFGYVAMNTSPEGAKVKLITAQGQVVASGPTPFHSPRLASGEYQAQFEHDLYESHQVAVVVPKADKLVTIPPTQLKARFKESEQHDLLLQVRRRLAEVAPNLAYKNVRFDKVIEELKSKLKFEIVLDQRQLEISSVSKAILINLSADGISVDEALKRLLQPLELTYVPQQDAGTKQTYLLVTSREGAKRRLLTVIHQVRDLIGSGPTADFRPFIDEITTTVAPNSWDSVGGPGSIDVNPTVRALTVSQTWENQLKVADFLANMRQAHLSEELGTVKDPAIEAALALTKKLGGFVNRNPAKPSLPAHTLSFSRTPLVDADLLALPAQPFLEGLDLTATPVTAEGLANLPELAPKLKWLYLTNTAIDGRALGPIGRLRELTTLELPYTKVDDDGCQALASHPALVRIRLDFSPVGDKAVTALSTIRNLRFVSLSGTNVTDQGIASLAEHPHLFGLHLFNTPTSDASIKHLVSIPKLLEVSLGKNCGNGSLVELSGSKSVHNLSIAMTKIDNDGLAHLAKFPRLGTVAIGGKKFTDAAIPHLEAIPNLRVLSLQGTSITAEAVAKLRQRKPMLNITQTQNILLK